MTTFLNNDEQQQIRDCVAEVEKTTSGEIVPVVAPASSDYPRAQASGAMLMGLVAAVPACLAFGLMDMWSALSIFLGVYVVVHLALAKIPGLRRLFVFGMEMDAACEDEAMISFYEHCLRATRDRTGILIHISVFERRVNILADTGINEKVDGRIWNEVVDDLAKGIKEKRQAEAICEAVRRCGELVRTAFPVKSDDTNELPDLIMEK